MRAGRVRPQRAADMKKDVRILLVGERECARPGRPSPGSTSTPYLTLTPVLALFAPAAPWSSPRTSWDSQPQHSSTARPAALARAPHPGPLQSSPFCLCASRVSQPRTPDLSLPELLSFSLLGLSVPQAASFQTLLSSLESPMSVTARQVLEQAGCWPIGSAEAGSQEARRRGAEVFDLWARSGFWIPS